ncbi:hypothetical protein K438DRAFT_1755398 [Mycena galopus ATCC 62051]|nr:hypothetical protein K438DRAFT_1755398 [Mycena galopus ATCC 62051]
MTTLARRPQSVAALCIVLESPSLAPLHLPFLADLPVADDSALRTLSTEAQPGLLHPPHVDSLSASFASTSVSDADSGNLSTVVRTGGVKSPHSVPPLSLACNGTIVSAILLANPVDSERPEQGTARLTDSNPLPLFPSPAVFGDAPTATQPSVNDHRSAFAPTPVLPPLALPSTSAVRTNRFAPPSASSPSSPRPGSADSTSTAHDGWGADEHSDSGSGSDAGADAGAGMKQRRNEPKLLQRLKDMPHVEHAHV